MLNRKYKGKAELSLLLHDGWYFEYDPDCESELKKDILDVLVKPSYFLKGMDNWELPAEVETGDNMGEA